MPTLATLACAILAGLSPFALAAPPVAPPQAAAFDGGLEEARRHLADGRTTEALQMLNALLESGEGDQRQVRFTLAEVQLANGVPERAYATLEPLLAGDDDAEAFRRAGQAFEAQGDDLAARGKRGEDIGFAYEQAGAHYSRAAELGDKPAQLLAGFVDLYRFGNHAAARTRAEAMLAESLEDGDGLLLRGCAGVFDAHARSDDPEAAGKLRKAAIADLLAADKAFGGKRVEPWAQLAWLYEADEQAQAAVAAAIKLQQVAGQTDFATLYRLALRYTAERNWEPAAAAVLHMVRTDAALLGRWIAAEEDPTATARQLSWSVAAFVPTNRLNEARDVMAALCATRPEDAAMFNNWGLFARDTRRYEDAHTAYSRALELSPDDPALINDAALILHYYLHRDYDKVAEMYERAIELATEQLKDGDLDADQRQRVQTALRDARNNLGKLARGEYEWGM